MTNIFIFKILNKIKLNYIKRNMKYFQWNNFYNEYKWNKINSKITTSVHQFHDCINFKIFFVPSSLKFFFFFFFTYFIPDFRLIFVWQMISARVQR